MPRSRKDGGCMTFRILHVAECHCDGSFQRFGMIMIRVSVQLVTPILVSPTALIVVTSYLH